MTTLDEHRRISDACNATPMAREPALTLLRGLQKPGDPEAYHRYADDVLCALLKTLGYEDVVAEYEKVSKWYA